MAVIVGVHGIAQQYSGGVQLGTAWFDAICDGLIAAGYRAKADALTGRDLRVAFFGDLSDRSARWPGKSRLTPRRT